MTDNVEMSLSREHDHRTMQPGLGKTLLETRRKNGLSLNDVATGTGLSTSFLSLLEQGRSDLSVNRLMRLCDFYGMRPSQLLAGDGSWGPEHWTDPLHYVSPGEGSEILILGPPRGMAGMLPALTIYQPGAQTEVFSHVGEEFIYVVEGSLLLRVAGEEHLLEVGGSWYFKAELEHQFVNPDAERRAVKLSVQSEQRW